MKLDSFFVKGERCSGTNYLEKLLEENLRIKLCKTPEWKHGYFGLSVTDNFSNKYEEYLTIVIFRNVFDWVRSFYLTPHHLEGANRGAWKDKPEFGEFIRREVKMFGADDDERMMDRHPYHLEYPKNILELRKWKTENWLCYKKLNRPVHYLRYEDLSENPEKIIRDINDRWFGVDFTFKNWDYYKRENVKYEPKNYFAISPPDLNYLMTHTDWKLEKKIGYFRQFPNTLSIKPGRGL